MPPLEKPALAAVSPGQPVTAQGWNEIVDGLSDIYDAVLALGTGVLEVSLLVGQQPLRGAQVVAVPPGNWRVFIEAEGFRPEAREVTVPAETPLVVELARAGVVVPDLFGVP